MEDASLIPRLLARAQKTRGAAEKPGRNGADAEQDGRGVAFVAAAEDQREEAETADDHRAADTHAIDQGREANHEARSQTILLRGAGSRACRNRFTENYGAPGEIRTPDHLVRSQVLYPTELRAHEVAYYLDAATACQEIRFFWIYMAEREGFEPSMGF